MLKPNLCSNFAECAEDLLPECFVKFIAYLQIFASIFIEVICGKGLVLIVNIYCITWVDITCITPPTRALSKKNLLRYFGCLLKEKKNSHVTNYVLSKLIMSRYNPNPVKILK